LEDTTGISHVRIEMMLHHQMSQINWVARIFDDNRDTEHIIEGPVRINNEHTIIKINKNRMA
jgi:hypothetical protein